MRLLHSTLVLGLAFLLTGCGPSPGEMVGVYRLMIDGQFQGLLELKPDHTYVQTIKLTGRPETTHTGKWSFGDWQTPAKSPGHFTAGPDTQGSFVFLENAIAIEECPKCRAATFDVVPLAMSAGMMNVALAQDPKGQVAYDK